MNKKKLHIVLTLALPGVFAFFAPSIIAKRPSKSLVSYKQQLKVTVKAIEAKQNSQISAENTKLVSEGKALVSDLMPLFSKCRPLLLKVLKDLDLMQNKLSHEEIETGYHAGEKLPQNLNTECYEIKEFLVHPATVSVLLREKPKEHSQMQAELEELGHHLESLEIELKAKKLL